MGSKCLFSVLLVVVCCFRWAEVRSNRSTVGGWQQVEPHQDSVQKVAHFATKVISDRSNNYYHKKLIHVHEAKRQVVAGYKYNVTFDVGTTICRKNEANDETEDQCTLSPHDSIDRCLATVWERPWLKERQLLHFECNQLATHEVYFSDKFVANDQAFHKKVDPNRSTV